MPHDHQRHVVVFDVNVYLDVARLVGAPFTWEKFSGIAASTAREPVPHQSDLAFDSLRAIASSVSGRFAGSETLEVFTNSHIDKTVRYKALQSSTPDTAGYGGLGWTENDATALVADLIYGLTKRSLGGTLGETFPDGNPPLDHEDGMVFGACRRLAGDDPLCTVYCVTRDKGFINAGKSGGLSDHTRVLHPSTFLGLVRGARARYGTSRMRRED